MWLVFFLGVMPLLFFVILHRFIGLNAGLVAAVLIAVAEAGFTYYHFGELDVITISSLSLVFILSALSFGKKEPLFFKFQPAILSGALGILLLVTYWSGYPVLYILMVKYQGFMPENAQANFSMPAVQLLYKVASHYMGYFIFLHGVIVAWAAIKLSNWWWLAIKIVGFWVAMLLGMITSIIVINL